SGEGLVVVRQEDRVLANFLGRVGSELGLSPDQLEEERLRGVEALSDDLFVRLASARLDEAPCTFGGFCFDHTDGDVFVAVLVGDEAASDRELEDGVSEL